jgi:predicted nucleic acid-binding protein
MYLIDTSVWAGYFNGEPAHLAVVKELVSRRDVLLVCVPILAEVLQGFRTESGFNEAKQALAALPELPICGDDAVSAAAMYRKLRARGVTVRGTVDCLIAAAAIAHGVNFVTSDRDFIPFEKHFGLKLKIV